jgi:hypothetical protein
MFDLSKSSDQWREHLRRGGGCSEDDIAELEEHLHEEMKSLEKLGLSKDEAFLVAARRLGQVDLLAEEFKKVNVQAMSFARLRWMAVGVLAYLLGEKLLFITYQTIATLSASAGLSGYGFAAAGFTLSAAFLAGVAILAYRTAARIGLACSDHRWDEMRGGRIGVCGAALGASIVIPVSYYFVTAMSVRMLARAEYIRLAHVSTWASVALSVLLPFALAIWIVRIFLRQRRVASS